MVNVLRIEVIIMKKIFLVPLILLLSCGNNAPVNIHNAAKGAEASKTAAPPGMTLASVLSAAESGTYRQGELLVKFRSGVIAASSLRVDRSVGATRIRRLSGMNVEHVKLPAGLSVKDAIARYMQDPDVEYAEPNYLRHARSLAPTPFIPDDPYFGQQWGLRNTGTFLGGVAGADIKAPDAWSLTVGSHDVVIAVIDSGIDYTHPDLAGNIWSNPGEADCANGLDNDGNGFVDDCRGWNFVANNNAPLDDAGHGTFVSGIIGAMGNDGTGIAGVMWHVQLMPLKMLDANGDGSVADEAAAIDYVVMMKKTKGINIKAINASFGGGDFSNTEYTAISKANDEGILMISAAGNGSYHEIGLNDDFVPEYPASYGLPNIIAVAATDQNDNLADWSNFGPNSVDVAAPGVYILSDLSSAQGVVPCTGEVHPGLDFCDGTSFSVAFVTGLAGLLNTAYPDFSADQIRSTILRYVDVLPSLENRVSTGGRINAFKAVSSLMPPTDVTAEAESATSVTVAWTDNATGEDGYTLERSTGGGPFTWIASLGADSTSYTDTTVSGDTTYTYRVTAFNTIPATTASVESAAVTISAGTSASSTGDEGGGGGCAVGGRQNLPSAAANTAVLLMPLLVLLIAGKIRRRKKE
jgi:subtilisin family serine protease